MLTSLDGSSSSEPQLFGTRTGHSNKTRVALKTRGRLLNLTIGHLILLLDLGAMHG